MPYDTRAELLKEICNFSTDEVVDLLNKNKLSECCHAIRKRQVDGEGLLQLTERNLNLWKSDLTESSRGSLRRFVEDLNNNPQEYFHEDNELTSPLPSSSDALSDTDWDTEFEEEEEEEEGEEEPSRSADENLSHNGKPDGCSIMHVNKLRPGANLPGDRTSGHSFDSSHEVEENDNIYSNGTAATNGLSLDVKLKEKLAIFLERQNKPPLSAKPTLANRPSFLHAQEAFKNKNNSTNTKPSPQSNQTIGTPKIQQPNTTPYPKSTPTIGVSKMRPINTTPRTELKPTFGAPKMQQPNTTPSPEVKQNIVASRIRQANTTSSPDSKPTIGVPRIRLLNTAHSPELMSPRTELKPTFGAPKMQQPNTTPSPEVKQNILASRIRQANTTSSPDSKPTIGAPRIRRLNTAHSPELMKTIEAQMMQQQRHPLPPKPNAVRTMPVPNEKLRELPKPPSSPLNMNIDLVADLPPEQDDDDAEYDYEPIKGQTTGQHYTSSESVRSGYSIDYLPGGRSIKGSNENVYSPPSTSSVEDTQEVYESIPEKDELDEYVPPICRGQVPSPSPPRPLPPTPLHTSSLPIGRQLLGGLGTRLADEVADMIVRIKRGLLRCCHGQPPESLEPLEPPKPPERSGQNKFSTFPIGNPLSADKPGSTLEKYDKKNSNTFPLRNPPSASRPLPPTPSGPKSERSPDFADISFDAPSYMDEPWFHNVGREEARALIEGGSSKFSGGIPDGYFLLRPSSTFPNQPFTLSLWYKNRTYNLPVRKRPDFKYALGTVRLNEEPFQTIEELVSFHKRNVIPLKSGNGAALVGSTRLTETPPK